jgi:threonine dehydrogenase-like Zn-dependent dehydrogenase
VRAIVIEEPNAIALREIETPTPGPGEARVRSVVAGVCRTDLDILTGALDPRWVRFPVIPGHEWSGVVDAVGPGVGGLTPGQRVVCEGNIGCMRCARCRAGDTHLCASYDAVGFTRGGGWGEFVVVPARILHPLPDHVSFESAALVEPGSCVVKALGRARIEPAETVGVVGVGALGALAIRIARLRSPATIVAYGVRDEELGLARLLGADAVVNVAEQDAEAETRALVGGGGLDVVVETAGAVPAVELSTRLAREGGRVVVLGIAGREESLVLPADRIPLRDLTVFGSVGYTTAAWAHMVGLLREGLVDLGPIVTHRFALERFEDALAFMNERTGVVARIVLEHAAP